MQFISLEFFVFFVFCLLGLAAVPARLKCLFLLAGNLLFYMSWAKSVLDLAPIVAVTLLTWLCSLVIGRSRSRYVRKAALLTAVIASVGSLVYFKYSSFIRQTVEAVIPSGGYDMIPVQAF